VAIIGCGGVGSLLAEQVARLGVGGAVFVDFDHLKEANLNRAYGATREDAREHALKAEVARNLAEEAATAPGFEARAIKAASSSPLTTLMQLLVTCWTVMSF